MIGFVLVALQAVFVGYLFRQAFFPSLYVLLALAGLQGRVQLGISRQRKLIGALVLAVTVTVVCGMARPKIAAPSFLFRNDIGYAIVHYFLLWQAIEFFLRHPSSLTPALPLYGVIVMARAGSTVMRDMTHLMYSLSTVCFVLLTVAFLMCQRIHAYLAPVRGRRHYVAAIVMLVVVGQLAGWGAGSLLYRYRNEIDAAIFGPLLGRLVKESDGIKTSPKLGSLLELKQKDRDQVALYVVCDEPPGYLKARAYDEYARNGWQSTAKSTTMSPRARPPQIDRSAAEGENVFVLPGDHGTNWLLMEVWASMFDRGCVYTRFGPAAVVADTRQLETDLHDNLLFRQEKPNEIYRVYVGERDVGASRPLPDGLRPKLTQVPDDLDPRIRDLAARLLKGKATTMAKIQAVVGHFGTNHRYHLGIKVPEDQDPLAHFLLDRPPAHCEYFATGAAILLRLGRVPCRYVTGFVVNEKNPFGGHWLGRNRDAHAWVEAYDDGRGWMTVEATVAEGMPGTDLDEEASLRSYLWDYMKLSNEQRKAALAKAGIKGLLRRTGRQALSFLRRAVSLTTALIVAACVAVCMLVRHAPRLRARRPRADPNLAALHRLLAQMDRRMGSRGLTREPAETLHQFALRIGQGDSADDELRQVAGWYVTYAEARYGQAAAERRVAAPPDPASARR